MFYDMVNKRIIIIIGILILMVSGFLFFSDITGNTIVGSSIKSEINSKPFRIDDFGSEINEEVELDDTQNNS